MITMEDFGIDKIPLLPIARDILSVYQSNFKEVRSDYRHLIGKAVDAWIGERHIYIVDDEMNNIHIYTKEGQFVKSLGRTGEGPMEFRRVSKIEKINDTTLAVWDPGRALLSFFCIHDDTTFTYLKEFQIIGGDDLCILNNRVYVRGNFIKRDHGNVIRVYSLEGKHVKSFGQALRSPYEEESVLLRIAKGMIACLEEQNLIITASRWLPVVQAYTPDGQLKWEYRIPDFTKMIYMRLDGRILGLDFNDADALASLNEMKGGILYQMYKHSGTRNEFIISYYISTDGRGWRISAPNGSILSSRVLAIDGARVVAADEKPEPRFMLAHVRWPIAAYQEENKAPN